MAETFASLEIPSYLIVGSWVAFVAGVGSLGATIWYHRRQKRIDRECTMLEGRALRNEEDEGPGPSSPSFRTVVEVTTPDGRTAQITTSVASNPPRYLPGDPVPVRWYRPEGGEEAFMVNDKVDRTTLMKVGYAGAVCGMAAPLGSRLFELWMNWPA